MAIDGVGKYSQEYLKDTKDILANQIDGNGGTKDGKVDVGEAYTDLNIGSLLSGLEKNSNEYNKLKALTDEIPETLTKYAGSDGIFQAEEWADFLNGEEWGTVLDTYHSSSNFAKIEMGWIDNSQGMISDNQVTKGEVKVGLLNNLQEANLSDIYNKDAIGSKLEALVDKYAGEDGTFTTEEYTALKNDPEYKQIMDNINLVPFKLDNKDASNSDIKPAKSLPKIEDIKKKEYSTINPEPEQLSMLTKMVKDLQKKILEFENNFQMIKDSSTKE